MTAAGNIVIISEYSAPEDFVCLASHGKRETVSGKGRTQKRQETVFIHKSLAPTAQTISADVAAKYPCKRFSRTRSNRNRGKN